MLGRLSLIGAVVLTLSASLLGVSNASATDANTTRPTQAELQSAIHQLETLGDYPTYFGPDSSAVLSPSVPHYQEYLYLYNLVNSVQTLFDHYDDADYLARHKVSDETFQDALTAMEHAYQSCILLFGLNRTAPATSPAASATSSTTAPASTSTATPAAKTNANNTHAVSTAKTADSSTNQVTATTTKISAPTANATPDSTESSASDASDTIDTNNTSSINNDIAVPATGITEPTPRQVAWPAVIAVVITGAIVASVIIAVIIRHEPRHTQRTTRRRR